MKKIITLFLLIFSLWRCADEPLEPEKRYYIKYLVYGTEKAINAKIVYYTMDDIVKIKTNNLPWGYTFNAKEEGSTVYVSAKNNYESGSITTKIFVNGVLKTTSVSKGAFMTATSIWKAGM